MIEIIFTTTDGSQTKVSADGGTLMEAAKNNNISGIDGDCGGVCSCATCHIYIDESNADNVNPATDMEKDMLEFDELTTPESRLSCQIPITDKMNGLKVKIARS